MMQQELGQRGSGGGSEAHGGSEARGGRGACGGRGRTGRGGRRGPDARSTGRSGSHQPYINFYYYVLHLLLHVKNTYTSQN